MRTRSIKFKIPLILIVFSTVSVLLTGILLQYIAMNDLESGAAEKNQIIAGMVSNHIDQYLENASEIVKTAGSFSSMSYGDLSRVESEIFRIYDHFEHFDLIFYMDSEARMVFSKPSNENVKDRIYKDRSYYWEIFEEKKSVSISPLLISSVLEMPHFIIAAPVYNAQQETVGLIGAGIPLANIQNVINKTQKDFPGQIWLLDENGVIAVQPNQGSLSRLESFENLTVTSNGQKTDLNQLIGDQKTVSYSFTREGTEFFGSAAFVASSGWTVIVEQDEATFFADLRDFNHRLIVVVGLVIVISLIIGLFMANRITSPVNALVNQVRRMTQKVEEESSMPQTLQTYEEINELSLAFSEMKTQLGYHIDQLENAYQTENRLQEYLNNILYSVNNGILVVGQDRGITLFNRAAEEITNFNASERIGTSIDLLLSDLGLELKGHIDEVLDFGRTYKEIEALIHMDDSDTRYIRISASPVVNDRNETIGAVVLFRDVTQQKRMEDELRREDRIRAVGELSASIIHDIGNPLAGIKNLIELIRSESCPEAHKDEVLSVLESEVTDLNDMVINFLEFTRSSAKDRAKENLVKILENALRLMQSEVLEKQITIHLNPMDDLPDVLVDKRAMKQVFFNLLRNAVQAVSPGGQIVVTAAADSSTLWVGIKDDGVGMDDQQLKQLFQPFNSTREEGTGLGLFIAYNIIREHGGKIEVTSEQNHGTEFNVLLPLVEGVDV